MNLTPDSNPRDGDPVAITTVDSRLAHLPAPRDAYREADGRKIVIYWHVGKTRPETPLDGIYATYDPTDDSWELVAPTHVVADYVESDTHVSAKKWTDEDTSTVVEVLRNALNVDMNRLYN